MKRKVFYMLLLCLYLCGCSLEKPHIENISDDVNIIEDIKEIENNKIIEEVILEPEITSTPMPTPSPTPDPNILYKEDEFVMYKDGSNNHVDKMELYEHTENVPKKFNNYFYLLNHKDNYVPLIDEKITTSNLDIPVVSKLENAKEINIFLHDYILHTYCPSSLTSEDRHYEYFSQVEESGDVVGFSLLLDEEAVMYNSIQTWNSDKSFYEFFSQLQKQDIKDWSYFFSDMFTMPESEVKISNQCDVYDVETEDYIPYIPYEFLNINDYLILFVDVTMDITYLNTPYDGKLCIILDKYNATIIYSFIGYEKTLLENEIETPLNKQNMLNSINDIFYIQTINERNTCL